MVLGLGSVLLACGPGSIEAAPEPIDELSAAEACSSYCDNASRCEHPIPGCFDTCMSLAFISDDSECGAAHRELRACVGALTCEGLAKTMDGDDPSEDPCLAAKQGYFDLDCNAGAP